jgi:hypothetical protein
MLRGIDCLGRNHGFRVDPDPDPDFDFDFDFDGPDVGFRCDSSIERVCRPCLNDR